MDKTDKLGVVIAVCITVIVCLGIIAIALVVTSTPKDIVIIDDLFEITSGTSSYSCIISEIDNDLLLDCLKAKIQR